MKLIFSDLHGERVRKNIVEITTGGRFGMDTEEENHYIYLEEGSFIKLPAKWHVFVKETADQE